MEDFKAVKEKARSLVPGESRGKLIHVEQTEYGSYQYFYDETDKTYWYQSDSTEKFEKEMQERRKERRKCLKTSVRNMG